MVPSPTIESVRHFGETLPPRSLEIERHRRLPDDVAAALVDLGVFRMWVPERYGGHQQPLHEGLAVVEELAYWDGAVGWCAMIGATTSTQAAFLPASHAQRVYGDDPRGVTGGVAEPRGKARRVEGGLVADGRWSWGSGTHHCRWIGGGCRVPPEGDGEPPRALFLFFERDQVTLHDNWQVGGLRGTGSVDFEVAEAFVPEGRWVELGVDRPRVDDALYRFPPFGLLALCVASVGLGLARRSIDELVRLARDKRYVGSRRKLAERPGVQAAVAEAEAALLAARGFVDHTIESAWLQAGEDDLDVEPRRQLRLAATHAMRQSLRVVDSMHGLAGGTAVYEDCPLERLLRDVHVAASHGMVAPRTWELTGRLALGLDTDTRQL